MKHNSNLLSERVVFGLFSLLFILSAAQVAAILDMSEYEIKSGAQVMTSAGCLQVTHRFNIDNPQFFDESDMVLGPVNQYLFYQYFNIKNICSYNIYVINPQSLNPQMDLSNPEATLPSLSYSKIQRLNYDLNPENINVAPFANGYSLVVPLEMTDCPNCESGTVAFHASPVATSPEGLQAYRFAPNQTRLVTFLTLVGLPDDPGLSFRVVLEKIKYFTEGAIAGGVGSHEIKTHSFSTTTQNNHASDYIVVTHSPNYEPMILQGGGAENASQKGPTALPGLFNSKDLLIHGSR